MLSKMSLVIKAPSGNVLIVRTPQNNKWQFPFLFSDASVSTIINSILKTTINCGVGDVKSVNYLFEDSHKPYKESAAMPIIYYEIIIKKHILLLPNNFYSYLRYYSVTHLDILNNKSYDVEKYLNILVAIKKENKANVRIFNSF